MKILKNFKKIMGGILIGFISGLLGAGGGMLAVPILEKTGIKGKDAHANAVAIILPVALTGAIFYLLDGRVKISDATPYMIFGVIGAITATFVLKKISVFWLKILFSLFMIWAGVRLIFK